MTRECKCEMTNSETTIDAATRTRVIEGVIGKLRRYYVYPEVAERMEGSIRRRESSGEYKPVTNPQALCEALTADLREVSRDGHLSVVYNAEPKPVVDAERPSPEEMEERRLAMLELNYGFERVERLAGNIGYLDIRGFFYPEYAGDRAAAAMALLADTRALIIDLRRNRGGQPEMVAVMCSYLLEPEPVHLTDFYWREADSTRQSWTLRYVPGPRYTDRPVCLLIGPETFSGAEEFAYNLKALERATLVGGTTAGGAHPVMTSRIDEHFEVRLPAGRPVNPITGTNWEGTGVAPDIEVADEEALRVAHAAALKGVLEALGEAHAGVTEELRREAREALETLGVVFGEGEER